jgi:hypothetical protein
MLKFAPIIIGERQSVRLNTNDKTILHDIEKTQTTMLINRKRIWKSNENIKLNF